MMSARKNILLMVLMLLASGLAYALVPTHRIADDGKKVELANIIPRSFGHWHEQKQDAQIVSPVQKETMERIYSQTLTRVYHSDSGDSIMLSIAYGADQSDDKQMHFPEVCYPAQGFQILNRQNGVVQTEYGNIRVKRLLTAGSRTEPVTYWSTVGDKVVVGGNETKLEQLRYGFRGQIPDGLLFRVSSISSDTSAAYASQDSFVRDLLSFLSVEDRRKIAGLSLAGTGASGHVVQ